MNQDKSIRAVTLKHNLIRKMRSSQRSPNTRFKHMNFGMTMIMAQAISSQNARCFP